MNILILNWKDIKNPSRGGAEVIAFEFARKLAKEGHAITFFTRSFTGALPEETIDGVHIIRRGNRFLVYIYAYFYYRFLKTKPDKVIEMINTICWQTPLFVPKEKRILFVNQLAKEIFFYGFVFPFSWIAYLLERFEYLTYKDTQTICYSNSTRDDLIQFGIPKKNISLFPMGVDHKRYKKGKKSKSPLFVFVARLVPMKRPAECIEAIALLKKKIPKIRLAIIGNGPEEKNLENIARRLHVNKNIIFVMKDNFYLDKKKGDIKVKYMQEAWALLLPSVKEGWGMVVTEAAACGTPAIVTDVTGLRDSVIDKKTGLVLPNPSPQKIADAVQGFFDSKMREKFSKNAYNFSLEFSWEKSFSSFKRLIFNKKLQ